MAFSRSSSRIDISQSILTDIGRDQNFHVNTGPHVRNRQSIRIEQINISVVGPRPSPRLPQRSQHRVQVLQPSPRRPWPAQVLAAAATSRDRSNSALGPSQSGSRTGSALALAYRLPEGILAIDITTRLIIQISQLLTEKSQTADTHDAQELKRELKVLYDSLVCSALAIQVYDQRPLGQSLINTITPEVYRCREALKELLDKVNGTRHGLGQTVIEGFWQPVWWSGWDEDELKLLKKKLYTRRASIQTFLIALNSYVC